MSTGSVKGSLALMLAKDLVLYHLGNDASRFYRMSGVRDQHDHIPHYGDPYVWRRHIVDIASHPDTPPYIASHLLDLLYSLSFLSAPRLNLMEQLPHLYYEGISSEVQRLIETTGSIHL